MTASNQQMRRLASVLAPDLGIAPEELLAEAARLADHGRAVGATTLQLLVELVAAEEGLEAETMWAETARDLDVLR